MHTRTYDGGGGRHTGAWGVVGGREGYVHCWPGLLYRPGFQRKPGDRHRVDQLPSFDHPPGLPRAAVLFSRTGASGFVLVPLDPV